MKNGVNVLQDGGDMRPVRCNTGEKSTPFSKICTAHYVDSAMVTLLAPSTTVKTKVHMFSYTQPGNILYIHPDKRVTMIPHAWVLNRNDDRLHSCKWYKKLKS